MTEQIAPQIAKGFANIKEKSICTYGIANNGNQKVDNINFFARHFTQLIFKTLLSIKYNRNFVLILDTLDR
jgi:hypothetical protein